MIGQKKEKNIRKKHIQKRRAFKVRQRERQNTCFHSRAVNMHPLNRVVSRSKIRRFHSSPISLFPRQRAGIPPPPQLQKTGMLLDEDEEIENEDDPNEGTSAGHLYLEKQRQTLHYLRLIEHDMPRLVRQFISSSSSAIAQGIEETYRIPQTIQAPYCRNPGRDSHDLIWRRGSSCDR